MPIPDYSGLINTAGIDNSVLSTSNAIYNGPTISANDLMRQLREAQDASARRVSTHTVDLLESERGRNRMIGMRLHMHEGERFPFDYISSHLGDEKVFVFIVQNNTPVIIEDDRYLFPSDTLVAQLRLIQK